MSAEHMGYPAADRDPSHSATTRYPLTRVLPCCKAPDADVVTRDREVTQAWARAIFECGQFAGARWWSYYNPDWSIVGLWRQDARWFWHRSKYSVLTACWYAKPPPQSSGRSPAERNSQEQSGVDWRGLHARLAATSTRHHQLVDRPGASEQRVNGSEQTSQLVSRHADVIKNRRKRAALDRLAGVNVNGGSCTSLRVLHEMRAATNADDDEPGAFKRTSKSATSTAGSFSLTYVLYAADEGNVTETAVATSDGGSASPRSIINVSV